MPLTLPAAATVVPTALLEELLKHAALASRLASYVDAGVTGALAVPPLIEQIDAIGRAVAGLLGRSHGFGDPPAAYAPAADPAPTVQRVPTLDLVLDVRPPAHVITSGTAPTAPRRLARPSVTPTTQIATVSMAELIASRSR